MTSTSRITSYKDLIVWQRAMQVILNIYTLTKKFPVDERFGLTSQMRRSAVSIASNIAEGRTRKTRKEFIHFLYIAYGSSAELETQLTIAKQLEETARLDFSPTEETLQETMRMLNTMIFKLEANSPSS